MKKTISTIAISALAVAAFAQGTVNWSSSSGTVIVDTNSTVYFQGGSTGVGGVAVTPGNATAQFYYELLDSTTATSVTTLASLSSWTDTGLEAENAAAANGRLLLLNQAQNAATTTGTWTVGNAENLILVGWSSNLGTTYASAYANYLSKWATAGIANAFFGVSSVATGVVGVNSNPGVTVFGTGFISNPAASPMQLDLLQTVTVPEPTTLALAAIGGASMLLIRRKK